MASPAEQTSTIPKINWNDYSILEQPPESSALVLALKEDLYDELNLKLLVEHLKSVARFIRVTYYATGAAPAVKEVQEIRLDIFHLGNNISKLCDQSASTVASFRSTSRTVLDQLQATYDYLTDDLEEMAIYCLSTLSVKAEKMARAAEEMKLKFEQQTKEVEEITAKTIKSHGDHDLKAGEMKKEQLRLEQEKKHTEKLKEDFRTSEERARAEKRKYQAKEDREIENLDTRFFPTLGRVILGRSGLEKADEYRMTKIKYLEEEIKSRKQRHEAMAMQASILKNMENCRFDEIKYNMVVEFLHHAITALKGLAAVMQKAAMFWKQLQKHCQELAEDGVKGEIEKVKVTYSKEARQHFWKSKGFVKQAITYAAKWVALYSMCGEYMGEIRLTQKELYVYITENPTREECQAKLSILCKDFSEYADSARTQSEEFEYEATREMERMSNA